MAGPGLYIHVPFCVRRCPYCDFYSVSALELIPNWLAALAREVELAAPHWSEPFDTVYLGGGSPSLLNGAGLAGLRKALAPLDTTKAAEVTLEANPEDVTEEQARHWADWGVTRVSLGAQSFDDRWLTHSLSRTHQAGRNLQAAEVIKNRGLALALDLIYGHPGQEPPDWAADLARAADLEPEHMSTYCLTVEPGTALARSIADRLSPPPPPAESAAEMFLISLEALRPRGYERYEVSNFARPGRASRHNLKYWRREPYLGLGPSAHSFDGRNRWAKVASLRRWLAAMKAGRECLEFSEVIEPEAARLETVMLGLRLAEGLPAEVLSGHPRLEEFVASGHLKREGGRIRPTETGLLIADRLALELG